MNNPFRKKKVNRNDTLSDLLETNDCAFNDRTECTTFSGCINGLKKQISNYKNKTANTISKSINNLADTHVRYVKTCSDFMSNTQKELYEKQEELLAYITFPLNQFGEQVKSHVVSYSGKLLKIYTTMAVGFAEISKMVLAFSSKNENAFKFKLIEAKENAVHVGIFDKQTLPITDIQIESTNSIADDLIINKWYYINEYRY